MFDELQHYANKLKVFDIRSSYGVTAFELIGQEKGAVAFLVILDPTMTEVDVKTYAVEEALESEEEYLEAERSLNVDHAQQAVLKRASPPNYFLDVEGFMDALSGAMTK